jgi:hypothetical protein
MGSSTLFAKWKEIDEEQGKDVGQLLRIEPTVAVGFLAWAIWVVYNLRKRP